MDPIPMPPVTRNRRALLSPPLDNSPGPPQVSPSATNAIVFGSAIVFLVMLCLYCTFTRRRARYDTRRRLTNQLRASMPRIIMRQPANVSLPIRNYTKEEMGGNDRGTEDCPVCLVEFEEGEQVKVVAPGCEHVFHPVCIDRWLAMRNTCPVCRSAVVSEEMYSVEEWGEGDGEGGEREAVVNVENVVVIGEGDSVDGGEAREVVVSVDGDRSDEGEGEVEVDSVSAAEMVDGEGGERETAVNVENVVVIGEEDSNDEGEGEVMVSGDGDRNDEGEGEGEAAVNLERYREGEEGEVVDDRSEGESSESISSVLDRCLTHE